MAERALIVNADDFGLSRAVNAGIIEAHRNGIVTSASLLVNEPHAAEAVAERRALAPELGLGLHVCLTMGHPTLPAHEVRSLVDESGRFFDGQTFLERRSLIEPSEVAAEISAQCERFTALVGHSPDHLDCHQHVAYFVPAFLNILCTQAVSRQIPLRSPKDFIEPGRLERLLARIARENGGRGPSGLDAATLAHELAAVVATFPDLVSPDHFIYDFFGSRSTLGHLREILGSLANGVTELMCHPGRPEPSLATETSPRRADELAVLTDARLGDWLHRNGICLTSFNSWSAP